MRKDDALDAKRAEKYVRRLVTRVTHGMVQFTQTPLGKHFAPSKIPFLNFLAKWHVFMLRKNLQEGLFNSKLRENFLLSEQDWPPSEPRRRTISDPQRTLDRLKRMSLSIS